MPIGLGEGYIGAAGLNAISGVWGGGNQEPDPQTAGDMHLVNSGQLELYNVMLKKVMAGSGDFGMGQNVKAGKSQLSQFMADRGIAPDSGTGAGMYANMVGTAGATANSDRLGYAMNLLRSPLQVGHTSGSNYVTSSPSWGNNPTDQQEHNTPNQMWYNQQGGYPFGRAVGQFPDRYTSPYTGGPAKPEPTGNNMHDMMQMALWEEEMAKWKGQQGAANG